MIFFTFTLQLSVIYIRRSPFWILFFVYILIPLLCSVMSISVKAIYPLFCKLSSCDAAWFEFTDHYCFVYYFFHFTSCFPALYNIRLQYRLRGHRQSVVKKYTISIHHQKWENWKMILFVYIFNICFNLFVGHFFCNFFFVLFWLEIKCRYSLIFFGETRITW